MSEIVGRSTVQLSSSVQDAINKDEAIPRSRRKYPGAGSEATLVLEARFSLHASAHRGHETMSDLRKLLRDLGREIERLAERNSSLERRLSNISGALAGAVRSQGRSAGRSTRSGRRTGRRGAPSKFNDAQAKQLRKEYERGANSAQLARKYKAALPTILSTLRRAGTTLRRGRPSKKR